MNKSQHLKSDFLVLLAASIFGAYGLYLRFFPNIHPVAFLFAFQAVGTAAFLIINLIGGFQKFGKREFYFLISLAAVAVINDLTYFISFKLTTIANAAIAHQMVSVFLILLGPLLLREKNHKKDWIALPISIIGAFILYGGVSLSENKDALGITLALVSAIFYALVIILYRKIPQSGLTVREITFWRYLISTIIILPILPLFGVNKFGPEEILPLVAFGIIFAVIASILHLYGIKISRSSLHASIIGRMEPVTAFLYALGFLNEIPSLGTIAGGILIIGSSIWLSLTKKD